MSLIQFPAARGTEELKLKQSIDETTGHPIANLFADHSVGGNGPPGVLRGIVTVELGGTLISTWAAGV